MLAVVESFVVILLGPPGAGKGTHAGPLSQELGLPHIATGDLLREHIRGQSPLGIQAKSYIDQGHLVPDELVLDMLFSRVAKEDCKNGYILDGFPRTVFQGQAFEKRLNGQHRLLALHFYLSDAAIIERITGRLGCSCCGKPYHKTFHPPQKEHTCDHCKGKLLQRDDDREEIVRKRLEVYRAHTAPLIHHYALAPDVLHSVNGQNDKTQVFQDVMGIVAKVLRGSGFAPTS